jgi:uncharacterized damage-inducible protein DinB
VTNETHVLIPVPDFSPGLGYYVSAMKEVRQGLRNGIEKLSNEQIGRRAVAQAHPIGALALHIGEAEWWWILCNLAGRELTDEDRRIAHWDVLEDPDGFAANDFSAQYCLNAVDRISEHTRKYLFTFSDDDLDRLFSYEKQGGTIDVSLRWVLHHLMEHEAQHIGQIMMLKRLLG